MSSGACSRGEAGATSRNTPSLDAVTYGKERVGEVAILARSPWLPGEKLPAPKVAPESWGGISKTSSSSLSGGDGRGERGGE